ncbi:uncharacterized protein [Dermacentor andersoni]|uniref:uncharacterized protein isoform X10 n=1 Tax=Dermacentor andersoni TaxID=34620 RepID=UPI003B3B6444
MKHIVFLTACVLLFLVATSAEDQDDEETDQDDEETEEDRRFHDLMSDKNFNLSSYTDPMSRKYIRTKPPLGYNMSQAHA